MNNLRNGSIAVLGVISLVIFLAVYSSATTSASSSTVIASSAHFNAKKTYSFTPANAGSEVRCKVLEVDGSWLRCEGEKFEWVNTNVMMFAKDVQ